MDATGFRHGAWPLDAERTRFALWAPSARHVTLDRQGEEPLVMTPGDSGWFELIAPAPPGSLYRYLIDDGEPVPDPASRWQDLGVHGYSRVLDSLSFANRDPHWRGRPWHEAVIYEVHVGAAGGYQALIDDLPRLAALGVTALELMPLAEVPGRRNWGYDGVLPFAPHAGYGTPRQLVALIDAAHAHGLMVFLDVVYNHFGPDGNYLGRYAKDFFRHDEQTPWGDAIDFRRREVRDFFIENALVWLGQYGFDGLRLDAVHAISERGFLIEFAARVRTALGHDRHLHLVLENEDNCASLLESGFDAQWNDDFHNTLHVLLTGEREGYYADFAEGSTERLARCLSEGFVYQGETTRRGHPRGEPSAQLPPTAFVSFLQNHDQIGNRALGERLHQLCPEDTLRAATLLQLLCPMVPLLFMGEDWAAPEPFLFFTDHHGELAEAVCEGRRAEFAEFTSFADPQTREHIPDPNLLATFTASCPEPARRGEPLHQRWSHYYADLLAARHKWLTPYLPGTCALGCEQLGERALRAHWRLGDGQQLCIEINLGDAALHPPPVSGRLIAASDPDAGLPELLPVNRARAFLETPNE